MPGPHRYCFVIENDGTPATLAMSRLAKYMAKMADLLGQEERVHFVRLEAGSNVLVQDVDHDAYAAVHERIQAMRLKVGSHSAMKAYDALNALLSEDGTSGELFECDHPERTSPWTLDFPGVKDCREAPCGPIVQSSELRGVVILVGGGNDPVPVHLQRGSIVYECTATRTLAKEVARFVFGQPIKVKGTGEWLRDRNGRWSIRNFRIKDFEELRNDSLKSVVADVRQAMAKVDVPRNTLELLSELRHGED